MTTCAPRHIKADLRQILQLSLSLFNQLIVHNLTLSLQLCNTNLKMLLSVKVHSMYLLKILYGRGSRIWTYDAGVKVPCLTTWLYPYMVDLTWLEHATSSLQGKLSPIEIQTYFWRRRWVPTPLVAFLRPNGLANRPLCHHWVLLHVPVQLYLALNDYWCAAYHTRRFATSKTTR